MSSLDLRMKLNRQARYRAGNTGDRVYLARYKIAYLVKRLALNYGNNVVGSGNGINRFNAAAFELANSGGYFLCFSDVNLN